MQFQSCLLRDTVYYSTTDHILILNSAADLFALHTMNDRRTGTLTLAEDSIVQAQNPSIARSPQESTLPGEPIRQIPFHDYLLHQPASTMDVAVMNLLYQPSNAWMLYGLRVARYALRPGGRLYVAGAKDRGILTMAKRMANYFGNVETLQISKGQRVLCCVLDETAEPLMAADEMTLDVFSGNKLDEGTRHLLEVIQVRATDHALDLGCGAGFIGLHIAHLATKGHVSMVDASLAAVAASRRAIEESRLDNIEALPSDGISAVRDQRFDLVATNPPFHLGGIQTTEVAERFIHETAQVLLPKGRFYLVANRFLKYEPTILTHFRQCEEVAGDGRYKVLRATGPVRAQDL